MGENEGGRETPSLSFLLIVLAAVALIAVLLSIYFSGEEEREGGGGPAMETEQARVLFESFKKMEAVDFYLMDYDERGVGLPSHTVLIRGNGSRAAYVETEINRREVYFRENEKYLCEMAEGERKCAKIENSSLLEAYARDAERRFFDPASISKERDRDEFLIKKGALEFIGEVKEKEIGGRACTQITNIIDYRKLSVEDLAVIGISPSDPAVTQFSDFLITRCFGEEGFPLEFSITYKRGGQENSYVRTIKDIKLGKNEGLVPENLTSEKEVEGLLVAVQDRLDGFLECEKKTSEVVRGACYMERAINGADPLYCKRIKNEEKQDRCFIALIREVERPLEMCGNVVKLKDDCYAELAVALGNFSFCGKILNRTLKEECASLVGPGCTVDEECVIGGCSNQVCGPREKMEELVTTCEFLPQYGCYQRFGVCGCRQNGECGWGGSEQLKECLQNASG